MVTEFIMLIGLPDRSKRSYVEKMKEEGYVIHSSESLEKGLSSGQFEKDHSNHVFSILSENIKKDLENGKSCVLDGTNMRRKKRIGLLQMIQNIACVKRCILFILPVEVYLKRNKNSADITDDDFVQTKIKAFQCPHTYEGWDDIEFYREQGIVYHVPFKKADDFDQDNIHHCQSLGDHLKAAAQYCKHHGYPEYIQLAAKYHDCGKLYTQTYFNHKGEPSSMAHYYSHENYSAYLFLCDMIYGNQCLLDSDDDIIYVANLINWHMMPLNSWNVSEKAKEKNKRLIGEQMYKDIMMLHAADVDAH